MGHVYADIEMKNPRLTELMGITQRALVDTGAFYNLKRTFRRHYATQMNLLD